jgi:hypothetical protein
MGSCASVSTQPSEKAAPQTAPHRLVVPNKTAPVQPLVYRINHGGCSYEWQTASLVSVQPLQVCIELASEGKKLIAAGNADICNLAPKSLVDEHQLRSGTALDKDQLSAAREFFEKLGLQDIYRPSEEIRNYAPLVGQSIFCRDEFVSKKTGKIIHKWRRSQIVEVIQSTVKINFTGWSAKHDMWLDLETDEVALVCPPSGVLTEAQEMSGEPLNSSQLEVSLKYFRSLTSPCEHIDEMKSLSPPLSARAQYTVGQKVSWISFLFMQLM